MMLARRFFTNHLGSALTRNFGKPVTFRLFSGAATKIAPQTAVKSDILVINDDEEEN